jgi:hypothetical protein
VIPKAVWPVIVGMLAAVLLGGVAEAAIERKPWEDYEVLIERNLFSRQRGRRAIEAARPPAPPPPPAQRFVVLRGVSRRGESFTAFFEDTRSGEAIVAREGSLIVGGTVTGVELDGIRYELDGDEVEVGIGDNLEASGAPVSAAGAASPGPMPSAPADAGEVESILERLRRRRMEELGQ